MNSSDQEPTLDNVDDGVVVSSGADGIRPELQERRNYSTSLKGSYEGKRNCLPGSDRHPRTDLEENDSGTNGTPVPTKPLRRVAAEGISRKDKKEESKRAIIYSPSIMHQHLDTPEFVASRLAGAFNFYCYPSDPSLFDRDGSNAVFQCRTDRPQRHFYYSEDREFEYESKVFNMSGTPLKGQGPGDIPSIDIYYFDYQDGLLHVWWSYCGFIQLLMLFLILGVHTIYLSVFLILCWCFRSCLWSREKRPPFRAAGLIQLLMSMPLQLFFVAHLAILCLALVDIVINYLEDYSDVGDADDSGKRLKIGIQQAAIIIAVIRELLPKKWIEGLARLTDYLIGVAMYLLHPFRSFRQRKIQKQFEALVKSVGDQDYDEIHIVAYSFGSILAIDSLFPDDNVNSTATTDRASSAGKVNPTNDFPFNKIKSFVTIGCCFDLLHHTTRYFSRRRKNVPEREEPNPFLWVNFYERSDLCGSNFRNDFNDNRDPSISVIGVQGTPGYGGIPLANVQVDLRSHSNRLTAYYFVFWFFRDLLSHTFYFMEQEHEKDVFHAVARNVLLPLMVEGFTQDCQTASLTLEDTEFSFPSST